MVDLKQYGYIEQEIPPQGLIPGRITDFRREQYLAQKQENKFADDKAVYLQEKREWNKGIAMRSKQMKKNGEIRK